MEHLNWKKAVAFMMFKLLLFHRLCAGIGHENLKDMLNMKYEYEGKQWTIREDGPLNLYPGYIASRMGVDCNRILCSSESGIKCTDSGGNSHRIPDPLLKILKIMFPSDGGAADQSSCFERALRKNEGKKLLAMLMAGTLGKKIKAKSLPCNRWRFTCEEKVVVFWEDKESAVEHCVVPVVEFFSGREENVTGAGNATSVEAINRFLNSGTFVLQTFISRFITGEREASLIYKTLLKVIRGDERMVKRCFIHSDESGRHYDYELVDYANLDRKTHEDKAADIGSLARSTDILEILIGKNACRLRGMEPREIHRLAEESVSNLLLIGPLNEDGPRELALIGLLHVMRSCKGESEAETIMFNIITNSVLNDEEAIRKHSGYFFLNGKFMKEFLRFIPCGNEVLALCDAVDGDINKGTTYRYFSEKWEEFASNGLENMPLLIASIMCKDRHDMFDVMRKSNSPASKIYSFVASLYATGDTSKSFSSRIEFLDRIRVDEVGAAKLWMPIEMADYYAEKLKMFLEDLKSTNGASRERLEKIFCICFHGRIGCIALFKMLLEATFDLPGFPADFVYNQVAGRGEINPNLRLFFCAELLSLIIEKKKQRTGFRIPRTTFESIRASVDSNSNRELTISHCFAISNASSRMEGSNGKSRDNLREECEEFFSDTRKLIRKVEEMNLVDESRDASSTSRAVDEPWQEENNEWMRQADDVIMSSEVESQ